MATRWTVVSLVIGGVLLGTAALAPGPPPVESLDAPRNLVVLRYQPRVVLGWTYDGALTTGFEMERAIVAGSTGHRPSAFTPIGTPGRDTRRFRDPTSRPGMTYVYRVRAIGVGTVSPYSKEIIVRVAGRPRRD